MPVLRNRDSYKLCFTLINERELQAQKLTWTSSLNKQTHTPTLRPSEIRKGKNDVNNDNNRKTEYDVITHKCRRKESQFLTCSDLHVYEYNT
jgi:hypothetical protein